MNRGLLGYFGALFLPSAALIAAGSLVAYQMQSTQIVERIEARESSVLGQGAASLTHSTDGVARDTVAIANNPLLQRYLEETSDANLDLLARSFVALGNAKPLYDQVRWIDETGRERVRVDQKPGGAQAVAASALQDKSDRYYFKDALGLPAGSIYVSPLDLNVERGVVQVPHKPMLRIATPVFDAQGRPRGISIINYRAQALIDEWRTMVAGIAGHAYLLNAEGHYLHNPDDRLEWGFLFNRDHTLARSHPAVWQRMGQAESGQFIDHQGLWTFQVVRPEVGKGGYHWLTLAHVPQADLAAATRLTRIVVGTLAAALLLLGAAVSYLLATAWTRREQRQLQRASDEADALEASLRLLLQDNPNAMLIVDANGVVTESNEMAGKLLGRAANDLIGAGIGDLVTDEGRSPHDPRIVEILRDPGTRAAGFKGEVGAVRRNGAHVPVEVSIAPLQLRGQPHVVLTIVDISTRRQAEAEFRAQHERLERRVAERTSELAAAEANLRLIMESSADGLYVVGTDARITYVNPAGCRILDYIGEALLGRDADTLLATEAGGADAAAETRPVHQTLQTGLPVGSDSQCYVGADGRAVPVMYATRPMVREGQIVGAVVSFVDVTQRRAMDAAREAALVEASRLSRARSEFLANMSHEIRTPLNGILGLAQVGYRDSFGRTAAQDIFNRILESGRLLLGIIDDVLDFARIDAGKLRIESMPVALAQLVDEALTPIVPAAAAKGLHLGSACAADVPPDCVTDPLRVKQVLLNLLSNAVKFTATGGVTLSLARTADALVFAVEDTGIGISEEQQGRIFRAFEQADTSTTRRFGGTGLGLAISQRIAGLLGGELTVKSTLGVGSRFELRLPLIEPEVHMESASPPGMMSTQRVKRLEGLRILVAEDNEINQLVVQAMLAPEGPSLVFASDGEQAVQRITEEGPDAYHLVLMDLQMPVMDGYEATNRIRAMAPDLPIVAQTAHVLTDTIEQCQAAGMVAHVSKPVDRHQLIDTILRHARLP